MDALYEQDSFERFATSHRVPKACEPRVPAPDVPFEPRAPAHLKVRGPIQTRDIKGVGLFDAIYKKETHERMATSHRVPAACDPKGAPAKPFTTDAPVNASLSWGMRKAHMTPEEYEAMHTAAEDPMRVGRKGHTILPGQYNVTWRDIEDELGFSVDPAMINFGAIGEGCSAPKVLNKYVDTMHGKKYHGLADNRKLWYSKEAAEMLFHESVRKE